MQTTFTTWLWSSFPWQCGRWAGFNTVVRVQCPAVPLATCLLVHVTVCVIKKCSLHLLIRFWKARNNSGWIKGESSLSVLSIFTHYRILMTHALVFNCKAFKIRSKHLTTLLHLLFFPPPKKCPFCQIQQKEEAAQVELTIAQDHTIPPKSAKKGDFLSHFPHAAAVFCYFLPILMIWFLLLVFVDSKTSATSEDEENLVPKSTAKKVSTETVPRHLFCPSYLFLFVWRCIHMQRHFDKDL